MTIELTELLNVSSMIYWVRLTTLQHLAYFRPFATAGSRVHKNFQILISPVRPRHPRAFPNTHLRMV
jgi:hypothetical protein